MTERQKHTPWSLYTLTPCRDHLCFLCKYSLIGGCIPTQTSIYWVLGGCIYTQTGIYSVLGGCIPTQTNIYWVLGGCFPTQTSIYWVPVVADRDRSRDQHCYIFISVLKRNSLLGASNEWHTMESWCNTHTCTHTHTHSLALGKRGFASLPGCLAESSSGRNGTFSQFQVILSFLYAL